MISPEMSAALRQNPIFTHLATIEVAGEEVLVSLWDKNGELAICSYHEHLFVGREQFEWKGVKFQSTPKREVIVTLPPTAIIPNNKILLAFDSGTGYNDIPNGGEIKISPYTRFRE
jgi:hypothetical protein